MLETIRRRFTRDDVTYSHGVARFEKAGGQLMHSSTELTFQPAERELPEAFLARVCAAADDGDVVEFRMRDGKIVGAQITRRTALPLQVAPGETFEAFALRVQHFKDAPRA